METVQTPKKKFSIATAISWFFVALAIFMTLLPFWWVIRTAFSSQKPMMANPVSMMPVEFTTINFARVMGMVSHEDMIKAGGSGQTINFLLYLRNSIIATTLIVVGQTFFSTLAAYAFARLKFPFREQIFFLYLSALMIPGVVTLIPNYLLVHKDLGWSNTYMGIIAPYFLMSPFAVFFMRQFFLGINHEIEEAAALDGAGIFTTFWRIIVPISGPPISTLAILTFVGQWNNYLWPFLVAGKEENVRLLTVALAIFKSQTPQGAPDWTGLMAATLLSIVPTVLLFLFLGRKVVNSIQFTGFK